MGDFDWFQNGDLRRALELRRDGKYKQGLEVLHMASKNGCPEASYFIGEAYDGGGWSLKCDLDAAVNYYKLANQNGCSWGLRRMYSLLGPPKIKEQIRAEGLNHKDPITRAHFDDYLYKDGELIDELVKLSDQGNFVATKCITNICIGIRQNNFHTRENLAKLGDVRSQYVIGSDFRHRREYKLCFQWLLKAKKQGYRAAISELAQCYRHGLGCPKDMVKYVNYHTKSCGVTSEELWNFLLDLPSDGANVYLRALWYVGLRTPPHFIRNYDEILPRRIYNDTAKKVRDAMYCWILIGKKLGLCNDVTKLIALLVRKARKDPQMWGIKA